MIGQNPGGGIALAVAALVPDLTALGARTPFPCEFPNAVRSRTALPQDRGLLPLCPARPEDTVHRHTCPTTTASTSPAEPAHQPASRQLRWT
ncbi:acetylxylan esterase [Streptomyces sp. NPDC001393]